jgi:Cupin domain
MMIGRSAALKAAIAVTGLGIARRLFGARHPPARPDARAIVRRPLLVAAIDGSKTVLAVKAAQIDFAPSQQSGVHFHPMPVVGQVTRGTIRFQPEGEPPRTLRAGDAFYEPANATILQFDNASNRLPASFVAFYLMGGADNELFVPLAR